MAGRKFTPDDFMYPSSDDMPEAESGLHRRVVSDLIARLETRYAAEPNVVIEVTSEYTRHEDEHGKAHRYEQDWRVKEYYLFDPRGEYLDPPLTALRRTRGKFHAMPRVSGKYTSDLLGLTLSADGERLVLRDVTTGQEILTQAEQRAVTAEAENARLKAELEALRRKPTK